jgi:hypothetical protein
MAVQPPWQKYLASPQTQISNISLTVPSHRGALARSSRTRGGMRWTLMAQDDRRCCGRRSRVVLTPRRWSQAGGVISAGDGGKRARSPGRARRKPLKPLRGESRVFPSEPVVTTLVCSLHFARETAGAAGTRHSLRPVVRGTMFVAQPGRIAPRDRGLMDGAKVGTGLRIRLCKTNLLLRRRADRRAAGRPVQVGDRYKRAEP